MRCCRVQDSKGTRLCGARRTETVKHGFSVLLNPWQKRREGDQKSLASNVLFLCYLSVFTYAAALVPAM